MTWTKCATVAADGPHQSHLRGSVAALRVGYGAKAVGLGRYYLFPQAAAGQAGVERALGQLKAEILRDMRLMGARSVADLGRENLRFRC